MLGACLAGYFVYHAVQGDRGLLAWLQLSRELAESQAVLAGLSAERTALDWMRDQLKATGLDRRLTLSDEPLRADQIDDVARTLEGGG